MKHFIAVTLEVFLITFSLISQTHTFMLGYSGTCPIGENNLQSKNTNWSFYQEQSLNMCQGFYTNGQYANIRSGMSVVYLCKKSMHL